MPPTPVLISTDFKILYYPVPPEVPSISTTLVPWGGGEAGNRAFLRERSLGYLHSNLISIFASPGSF